MEANKGVEMNSTEIIRKVHEIDEELAALDAVLACSEDEARRFGYTSEELDEMNDKREAFKAARNELLGR